jgi:transcriptional regulator with XRE-family HTH domain
MYIIQYMDNLALARFGRSLKEMRQRRSLTQAQLAELARVPRLKVIQVERGDAGVSLRTYAAVAHALGAELALQPSRLPTLEEAREFFADAE